jgi:2-dehydropantoate 2-reductase
MEIEVILGVPMKRAQAKGVAVPHLETVYHVCSAANYRIINKGKSSL